MKFIFFKSMAILLIVILIYGAGEFFYPLIIKNQPADIVSASEFNKLGGSSRYVRSKEGNVTTINGLVLQKRNYAGQRVLVISQVGKKEYTVFLKSNAKFIKPVYNKKISKIEFSQGDYWNDIKERSSEIKGVCIEDETCKTINIVVLNEPPIIN